MEHHAVQRDVVPDCFTAQPSRSVARAARGSCGPHAAGYTALAVIATPLQGGRPERSDLLFLKLPVQEDAVVPHEDGMVCDA